MLKKDLIRQKLPLLETVDLYFLLLRLMTIAGGAMYYLFTARDYSAHQVFVRFFPLYALYSSLLYAAIFRWPKAIQSFYLTTLVLDMLFIFVLILYVGLFVGSFFIAFYLLVAIHSFYFGLRLGLIAALAFYFFGPKKAGQAQLKGDVQEVRIEVKGGYSPNIIRVRRGVPLRLIFDRREDRKSVV